jgi:hypothetical protein
MFLQNYIQLLNNDPSSLNRSLGIVHKYSVHEVQYEASVPVQRNSGKRTVYVGLSSARNAMNSLEIMG